MSLERKGKKSVRWERKLGGDERLKSLLLLPTALRSEMRLLRVSEPSLLVETHPPRLRFKTKVKMRRGTSLQFAVDLEKAINWRCPYNVELRCRLQGVCLSVCFQRLEMTFKEIE